MFAQRRNAVFIRGSSWDIAHTAAGSNPTPAPISPNLAADS